MSPIAFYIAHFQNRYRCSNVCPTKWESVNTKGQTDRQRRVKCFVLQFFFFSNCPAFEMLTDIEGLQGNATLLRHNNSIGHGKNTNNNHIWVTSSGKRQVFFFVLYESTSAHTNRECTSLIRTWLHSFFFCSWVWLDGSQARSPAARHIARFSGWEKWDAASANPLFNSI